MIHKDIDYKEEHENIRKQLWMNVYVSYVGAANSMNKDGAAVWADIALQRFDERFKAPQEREQKQNGA